MPSAGFPQTERPRAICRLYIAPRGLYLTSFAVAQFYVPKVTEASGDVKGPDEGPLWSPALGFARSRQVLESAKRKTG